MSEEITPEKPRYPTIQVAWDADLQRVRLALDPAQFKNWDFVQALLGMAQSQAEKMSRFQDVAALQAAEQDRKIADAIAHNAGKFTLARP